jgi:hypothetical protein
LENQKKTTHKLRMKKLLILTVLLSATVASFGQGIINWANTSGTLISVDSDGPGPAAAAPMAVRAGASTTFNFGLFLAPGGTAAPTGLNDPNWQLVTAYALNSTAAAGAGRMLNPGLATSATYAPGTSVSFIVRSWQSVSGSADWAAVQNELLFVGTSGVGSAILGGGALPTPSAFGSGAGFIGGFTVNPVPEPSSMVLAGLGAASLLLFRRRK